MAGNLNTPLTVGNKFYSEDDFQYETDLMMEYLEGDLNQTIVLYAVDRAKTNLNTVYKETRNNGVRFKPPVEIPCLFEIKEADLKSYDSKSSNGVYTISGPLTVWMMPKMLKKYKAEISRGDYIGVPIDTGRMVYFVVTNDGKVNTSNNLRIGAYKVAWRVITAAPVDDSEFSGK